MDADVDMSQFDMHELIMSRRVCEFGEIGCGARGRVYNRQTRMSPEVPVEIVETEIKRRHAEQGERMLAEIKKAHTRLLMKWLRLSRLYGGWYSPEDPERLWFGVSADDLCAELAKRPHVPNKKEGRALRQEAARQARRGKRG